MKNESRKISDNLYVIKLLAIISVIIAHVNRIGDTQMAMNLFNIFNSISLIGVPIFLIIAGYYYRGYDKINVFIIKKIKTIIIPWFMAATLTFIIHSIKINSWVFVDWIKWIFGIGSLYYFMTVYFIFILFFNYFKKTEVLYIVLIINILSLLIESTIGINYNFITSYTNPINWCGYFAIGMLIKRKNYLSLILNSKKISLFSTMLFVLLFTISICIKNSSYFNFVTFFGSIFSFVTLLLFINKKDNQIFESMKKYGKCTFFIYLYHIQIVQFVCFHLPNIFIINLLNPIIALMLMILIINVINIIYKKNKRIEKITSLIGLDIRKI